MASLPSSAAASVAAAEAAVEAAVCDSLFLREGKLSHQAVDDLLSTLDDWEEANRNCVLGKSLELLAKIEESGNRPWQLKSDSLHCIPETPSAVTIPAVVALPPAGNYVNSVQSTRVADDMVLRHLPYFGDNDSEGVDLDMYDNRATLAMLETASGSDDYLVETLARQVVEKSSLDSGAQAQVEYILHRASQASGHTLEWMKSRFEAAVDNCKLRKQIELQAAGPRVIRQSTFSALLCRRCFLYDCRMHGSMHAVAPLLVNENHKSLWCSLQSQRQEIQKQLAKSSRTGFRFKQQNCSPDPDAAGEDVLVASRDKHYVYASDILEHILMVSGGESAATVSLGNLIQMDLPLIKHIVDKKISQDISHSLDACDEVIEGELGLSPPRKAAGRGKKRRRGSHRPKIVQPKKPCESDKNIFYSEYIPCNHVDCCVLEHELPTFSESAGNGDSSSSLRECCVESGHRCEKFCICPASCLNRWPGCNCSVGQCRTALCPCVQASRECDPDVCRCGLRSSIECLRTFGAVHARLQLLSDSGCECRNCVIQFLQLGLGTRLYIGPSEVNGWGLFVNERVEKGVFLKEYVGEAISQNEADRRGKVYDRHDTSYLFNVNFDNVLDAMRVGNKSRFANHSKDPNAYAKVVLVNGDQKIGLYAKRLLLPGTEVLYNYMHEFMNVVPEWQKTIEGAEAARKHVHSVPRGTENRSSVSSLGSKR